MGILGVILLLAGAGSFIFGIIQNNSVEAQLTSLLTSGNANPGTVWMVIGGIAAVVGIVLLVVNSKKNK